MTDETTVVEDATEHRDDPAASESGPETQEEPTGGANTLKRWLRKLDPTKLGMLGLLVVPSWFIDSLEFLQIFWLFFLFFLWEFIASVVDAVLNRKSKEKTEPTDWIQMGDWRELVAVYAVLFPTTFLNPIVLVQDAFQLAGSLVGYVRYRVSVPDVGDDLDVTYRLPIEGTWTVINGSLSSEYSHSWFPLTQRYAYDFVITDHEGHTRPEGTSTGVEEYYCYDKPVLAPASGVVVDILDSDFEFPRGGGLAHPLKRDIRGNYVTIQHAPDEYSSLAHLVPGSVEVKPGDRVEQGQQVGRCGHSGNSSEPHLHFQLQDSPSFETAAGLPVRFDDIEAEHPSPEKFIDEGQLSGLLAEDDTPTGQRRDSQDPTAITAGQRVTADRGTIMDRRADTDRQKSISPRSHGVTNLLQRTGFGASVGALLAGVAGFVLAESIVTLVLVGSVLAGSTLWTARRLAGFLPRPGGLGLSLGIALVALAWWGGLLTGVSLGLVFVAGFLWYAAVGEIYRMRLRRTFEVVSGEGSSDVFTDSPGT